MSDDASQLTEPEALNLFGSVFRSGMASPTAGIALLAVSGGPDSMALLWLAAQNRPQLRRIGIEIEVATVDHGLREAARAEASMVGHACRTLGIPHRTLRWEGDKPRSNLQGEARRARYRLLETAAAASGATSIVTAHHQDDQIETHDLAAERGAGSRGLAGMRPRRALAPGLDLLRPFLDIDVRRLRATAVASGLPFVDDPSNADARYARVRLRQSVREWGEGMRAARLAEIDGHRAQREVAERALGVALGDCEVRADELGVIRLAAQRYREHPVDIRAGLLGRIAVAVVGAEHEPERRALDRLDADLMRPEARASTLGGVRIEPGGTLAFAREYGRTGPEVVALGTRADRALFDGRFDVRLDETTGVALPELEGGYLAPFGVLGRGDRRQRTLPILVGRNGLTLAVPELISHKMRETSARLRIVSRVPWRLWADLPRVETA